MTAPDAPFQEERWLRGLQLLRDGAFWEAHEAWEELWLSLPKDSSARRATRALIQLAAICHKPVQATRGRAPEKMQRGMSRLLVSCAGHLEAARSLTAPSPCWDVDAMQLPLAQLEEVLNAWKAGQDGDEVCRHVAEIAAAFVDELIAE